MLYSSYLNKYIQVTSPFCAWEDEKVRREESKTVVRGICKGEKADFSLPEEPKPVLPCLATPLPPAASLRAARLTCFSLVASPQKCEYSSKKRVSLSALLNHSLKNTAWRSGIFSLMCNDKVLKCQHDKNKINNSNKPYDASKNVRLATHAVQWNVPIIWGLGREYILLIYTIYSFKVPNCYETFLSQRWSGCLSHACSRWSQTLRTDKRTSRISSAAWGISPLLPLSPNSPGGRGSEHLCAVCTV